MSNMVLRSSLILLIAMVGIFFRAHEKTEPDTTKKEFFTLQAVIKFLDRVHYDPKEMNDDLSEKMYKNYLGSLDPGKRFLTLEDIDKLDDYELKLDDQIQEGSFDFLNLAESLIATGVEKAEKYYLARLEEDIDIYSGEHLIVNSDQRDFAANDDAHEDYWNRLIQYETIVKVHNLIKAQVDDEEKKSEQELIDQAKESIGKTFGNWFKRLKALRRSDRFEDYLNAITNTYDPHSVYFSPKDKVDFDINLNGSYEGIGARLIPDGEFTKVTEVIPGGPAWKQKELEENDLIMGVAQGDDESKDVRGWRQDDVIGLIRGKKGTKVVLKIKKADGLIEDIAIIRDQVILEEGKARSLLLSSEEEGPEVGYISLPKFYFEADGKPGCAEDVANEIKKLEKEGAQGIVLDLRNNGGGSLSEVVDMSGLFFEEGPVVQVKSRGRKPYVLKDEDPATQYKGPLVVMVNHFSASASEIIAAALQDYDRAVIVGSNSTFGKGTVQRFHQLDRFVVGNENLKPLGEVKITTQKFYRVNGGSTQLKGVVPDIILPSTYGLIKVGEKEYDQPLAWSEISPVNYDHVTASLPDRSILVQNSETRVAEHEIFNLVNERAEMLKKQEEDELQYPLNLTSYTTFIKEKEEENASFKDMFGPIDGLNVMNLDSNNEYINSTDALKANNEELISDVKKDIYIDEVLHIMQDIINLQ